MKKYLENLKTFQSLYTLKERLSALLGGLVFADLIFLPVFIILAEMMIVYIYMVYTLAVIMIVAAMGFSVVASHFNRKALSLKKPEMVNHPSLKHIFFVNQIVITTIIVVIGLCFILWWIPLLMV